MDRYDILEAMSGIRDEYIEEAASVQDHAFLSESEEHNEGTGQDGRLTHSFPTPQESGDTARETTARGKKKKRAGILHMQRWAAAAAALLCICAAASVLRFGILKNRSEAQKQTGMSAMSEKQVQVDDGNEAEIVIPESASSQKKYRKTGGTIDSAPANEQGQASAGEESYADTDRQQTVSSDISVAAAMSDAKISDQIREVTEKEVRVFEDCLAEETGYSNLRFTHEVTTDSKDWFSLRMLAYTSPEDGFEQVTHFNIRRDGTKLETLETLFGSKTDYIGILSEEVIRQMREQMAADREVEYWLDSAEGPSYDFQQISPTQDFYFDRHGNLVLCFNEGEAAPTYMGEVEFTIPAGITKKLLES